MGFEGGEGAGVGWGVSWTGEGDGWGGEAWDVGRERGVKGDYMGTRYTGIRDRNATGSTEGERVEL